MDTYIHLHNNNNPSGILPDGWPHIPDHNLNTDLRFNTGDIFVFTLVQGEGEWEVHGVVTNVKYLWYYEDGGNAISQHVGVSLVDWSPSDAISWIEEGGDTIKTYRDKIRKELDF